MTQLQIELPDEVVVEVKRRADSQGLSITRFVTELVAREVSNGWPKGFFEEVVGGWKGEPLERPTPLTLETREEF
jgi:hypothetical protein